MTTATLWSVAMRSIFNSNNTPLRAANAVLRTRQGLRQPRTRYEVRSSRVVTSNEFLTQTTLTFDTHTHTHG